MKFSLGRPAVLFLALALLFAAGCDKKMPTDAFFDKWRTMAKESKGFSPTDEPEVATYEESLVDKPEPAVDGEEAVAAEPEEERELPETPVTMRFRKTSITAVIQAMARMADISIMLSPDVQGQVTVNVVNTPWGEAFNGILRTHGLSWNWEGGIVRVLTPTDMETELKIVDMNKQRLSQEVETEKIEPPVISVIKPKYAKSENLREPLEKILSRDTKGTPIGSVQVDAETNSLIVQAIKQDVQKVIKLVNRLDVPRRQVHLKAHIVEATTKAARSLGIQWGGIQQWSPSSWGDKSLTVFPGVKNGVNPLGTGYADQGWGISFPPKGFPSEQTGGGAMLGLGWGVPGVSYLEVQLMALEEDSQLNILSSPSITTLDNEKAVTENGAKVPYVTTENAGGVVTRTVKFVDAVLRLEIEPQIIDEQTLRMKVIVVKDEPDRTRAVDGNPYIIKKNTETTLIINSGETIVISGLTKTTDNLLNSGVPGVKNTPVLGWLFGSENTDTEKEEVLIFVTPTILPERKPGQKQKTLKEIEEEMREREEKGEKKERDEDDAEDNV